MKTKILILSWMVVGVGICFFSQIALAANYNWVPAQGTNCDAACGRAGQAAVYSGTEGSKSGAATQLYVCGVDVKIYQRQRQQYSSGFVPGKNVVATTTCNVPFNGKENILQSFVCLCVPR
jgi:hypothetical protein